MQAQFAYSLWKTVEKGMEKKDTKIPADYTIYVQSNIQVRDNPGCVMLPMTASLRAMVCVTEHH